MTRRSGRRGFLTGMVWMWVAMASLPSLAVGRVEYPSGGDFPIRVSHVGYLPAAPKFCTACAPSAPTFLVQRGTTNLVWQTVGEFPWRDSPYGAGIKVGDFSSLTEPGDYRILCGSFPAGTRFGMPGWLPKSQSYHFQIRDDVYGPAKRMLRSYFTWQRCGSALGWAGECHRDPVPLVDADGKVVRTIDVSGGYHQSSDLRNWHDGISMSIYAYLRAAQLETPRWDRGEQADEIRWACDYYLKVVSPEGYVYDAQFTPLGWGPRRYYVAPAALGAQCNIILLLARASRFFAKSDAAYAQRLLTAARRIFDQVEAHPFFAKAQPSPVKGLPPGAQPAERFYPQQWRTTSNGYAERAGAALALYRATGEARYADLAKEYAGELVGLQIAEGAEAGRYRLSSEDGQLGLSDCSYCWRITGYRVPLEMYRTFLDERWKAAALRTAEAVDRQFRTTGGWPAWTVEKPAGASTAAAWSLYLAECADVFARPEFRPSAQRLVDWIFGSNAFNRSYVEGVGMGQAQRPIYGQFFPSTPQIPGAVLHVHDQGEYDMPAVAMTLWAVTRMGREEKE